MSAPIPRMPTDVIDQRKKREDELAALLLRSMNRHGLNLGAMTDDIEDALEPALAGVFVVAANRLSGRVGFDLPMVDLQSRAWSQLYSPHVAQQIQRRSGLMLQQARGGGLSLEEALDKVFTRGRASTIATTEITRGTNAGREYAAQVALAIDLITTPLAATWAIYADDDSLCPICRLLDTQPREVWSIEYPYGPPAHPNCRCWIEYDFDPEVN